MTKNRKQKQAARKRATGSGQPYLQARQQVRVPTWFNSHARKTCSACGAHVEWVDADTAIAHGMDVSEGLKFLGASVRDVQFWVCSSCDNAGIMGPIEGDFGADFLLDDGEESEDEDDQRDPLLQLLDEAEVAYRAGIDPSTVLTTKPDLLYRIEAGTYDAVAFTMGTHFISELWKMRGSKDPLDKLVQLVVRRSARRLGSARIGAMPAEEAVDRCLIGWLDDARGRYLDDGDLEVVGIPFDAIPEDFSGAVEWLAQTDHDALAVTAASVVIRCELGDMYDSIAERQRMGTGPT
jgi:hypothetical protein